MHMQDIIASSMTVSDKIRALDAAGRPRAEIARLLGKRYQHVRNVLEADKLRGNRAVPRRDDNSGGGPSGTLSLPCHLDIQPNGSIVLPAELVSELGLADSRTVVVRSEDGAAVLTTPREALEHARALVRRIVPKGTNLADELIADRRREASQDDAHA